MRAALLSAMAVLLAACGPRPMLPELPALDLSSAQPSVRAAVDAALAEARAHPADAAAVARLGMVLHAHGQYASAARAYERAAKINPRDATYLYYWGTALAGDGRYAEAVQPLRSALSYRSGYPPILLKLADCLYEAGETVSAQREYRRLANSHRELAAAQYGLGRTQEGEVAAASLERAVALYPRYGAARFALAAVYRQLGRPADAAKAMENYERDKLDTPPLDDPDMAAVFALDTSATGLLRAAQALERQGQLAQAAELQERAVAADPKLAVAWVNLISLYGRLGQLAQGEAAYRKATQLEPNNGDAHYNFGVLCVQAGRFEDARKSFELTIKSDPAHAEALDNLGAIIERTGNWSLAASYFEKAVAARPGLLLAQYHLGRSYANQQRYPEAIAALEKASEGTDDQMPGYLYALGAVHARAGHRQQAMAALFRARGEARKRKQDALAASIDADLAKLRL